MSTGEILPAAASCETGSSQTGGPVIVDPGAKLGNNFNGRKSSFGSNVPQCAQLQNLTREHIVALRVRPHLWPSRSNPARVTLIRRGQGQGARRRHSCQTRIDGAARILRGGLASAKDFALIWLRRSITAAGSMRFPLLRSSYCTGVADSKPCGAEPLHDGAPCPYRSASMRPHNVSSDGALRVWQAPGHQAAA